MVQSNIVPMIIRGKLIETDLVEFPARGGGVAFLSPDPAKYIDALPMRSPRDLADLHALKTAQIIDFLVELGTKLDVSKNNYLQDAREIAYVAAPTTRPIVEDEFNGVGAMFQRDLLHDLIAAEEPYFDGWVSRSMADGRNVGIRAFGARCVHIVAGNSPFISALTVIRSALTRGDAIIKSPSNDPFTASALVRTMIDLAPDHPVTKHFSVAYWKGGDENFERRFYQPSNIEKILAWGGFASVKHVTKYIQPGLELISLDPKRSCSIIGAAAFEAEATMREAAMRVATDVGQLNQVACANSRTIFVMTGTDDDGLAKANTFGRYAYEAMMELPDRISTKPKSVDRELKSNVEAIRDQEEWYNVIGGESDEGAMIVSQMTEAVDFATSLNNRVANIVPVASVDEITGFIDSYTQTVGVYPEGLKDEVKDILPLFGAQRIVTLGYACSASFTLPQDSIEPIRRMAKWIVDEGCLHCTPVFNQPAWQPETAVAARMT